jgi:hypothetical protein
VSPYVLVHTVNSYLFPVSVYSDKMYLPEVFSICLPKRIAFVFIHTNRDKFVSIFHRKEVLFWKMIRST